MSAVLAALLALATPPAVAAVEGQRAPAFQLYTHDGARKVKLAELTRGAKPVLLDFFRTDCGPCLASMPDLVKLHAAWAARGVEVYLVALLEEDGGRAKLDRYLAKNTLPFPVLVDENEHWAKKYLGSIVALPATFLIDREGNIVKTRHGAKGTLEAHFGEALARVTGPR